jgi:hypothetical protein
MYIDIKKYNFNTDLIESVELLTKLPNLGTKKSSKKNIFDYFGKPSMSALNYEDFIKNLNDIALDLHNEN